MVKHTIFLSPRIEVFFSHSLSQTFHHLKIVLFVDNMATRQEFMLKNIFAIKEEYRRTLPSHLTETVMFF